MEWTLRLEATTLWGERTCVDLLNVKRPALDPSPAQVGLSLAEAKELLARLQQSVVEQQAAEYTFCRRLCVGCSKLLRVKDYQERRLDTLFGPVRVRSPRWEFCRCRHWFDFSPTFSPLSEIMPHRCTPELEYLVARLASEFSYRRVVALLGEFLPVSPTLNHATVRARTLRVGDRLEADQLWSPQEPSPPETRSPAPLPSAAPAVSSSPRSQASDQPADAAARALDEGQDARKKEVLLSVDTGWIRSCHPEGARCFEVTVGRCERAPTPRARGSDGANAGAAAISGESFGFVASETDPLAPERWRELLARQGHPGRGEPLVVLSDGADTFRVLARRLDARHIMDWFHVAMRFRRLEQLARGARWRHPQEAILWEQEVARAKWRLWHGQQPRALEVIKQLGQAVWAVRAPQEPWRDKPWSMLLVALNDMGTYLKANADSFADYGRRYRRGQRISTAPVESLVNRAIDRRFAKAQQMRWSRRGAHRLGQVHLAVLGSRLEAAFGRWYKRFRAPTAEPAPA